MDNIIFYYSKKKATKVQNFITDLDNRYILNNLEDLKWFLGIHIIRDRIRELL